MVTLADHIETHNDNVVVVSPDCDPFIVAVDDMQIKRRSTKHDTLITYSPDCTIHVKSKYLLDLFGFFSIFYRSEFRGGIIELTSCRVNGDHIDGKGIRAVSGEIGDEYRRSLDIAVQELLRML